MKGELMKTSLSIISIVLSIFVHSANASNWNNTIYINGSLGFSAGHGDASVFENRFSDAGVDASIRDFDDDRFGWRVNIGYQLMDYLAFEVGYMDFEDAEVRIIADNNNLASALQVTNDILPLYVRGWGGALVGILPLKNDFRLLGKIGSHEWDGGQGRDRDSNAYYGLGVDYIMNNEVRITGEVTQLSMTQSKTEFWSMGITYFFHL